MSFIRVGELRAKLQSLPEDAMVLVPSRDGTVEQGELNYVKVGHKKVYRSRDYDALWVFDPSDVQGLNKNEFATSTPVYEGIVVLLSHEP